MAFSIGGTCGLDRSQVPEAPIPGAPSSGYPLFFDLRIPMFTLPLSRMTVKFTQMLTSASAAAKATSIFTLGGVVAAAGCSVFASTGATSGAAQSAGLVSMIMLSSRQLRCLT